MLKNTIMLQKQQDLVPFERIYHNKIDYLITSSKDLSEAKILYITKKSVYLDFGTKSVIKVSRKTLIDNLIQTYCIINTSYLLTKKMSKNSKISKDELKKWLKTKLQSGQNISLNLQTIDSLKNIYTVNFKKTLEYIKYNKFFAELYMIKASQMTVKGFILNTIKGGFSVAIGGLIAFLPTQELIKKSNRKLMNNFVNSSMNFKVAKINFKNKNVVLQKA